MIIYLEIIYIIYILVFFKTKISFHHPLEIYSQIILKNNYLLDHKIYNEGLYENKICLLGHILAYILAIWILFKNNYPSKKLDFINFWLWILIMIISFILNPNAFIYLLPVFILEIFYNKYLN